MSRRLEQINEVLKRELGQIILEHLDFGRNVLITVNKVDTAPNLSEAKIYVSVLPESFSKEVLKNLQNKSFEFHRAVNKIIHIRKIPKLFFCEEKALKEAAHIDELLKEIHDKENKAR
jgi:ribosome-binding factor A